MFEKLSQWPHWGLLRFATGLIAALATVGTVAFGTWTYYQDKATAELVALQDNAVFEIVMASGKSGMTLAEISEQYATDIPQGASLAPTDKPTDDDVRAILLRLPNVTPVDDRWYVSSGAPLADLQVFIEDIVFGIPQIPDTYSKRALQLDEIDALLRPLLRADVTITLTDAEVQELNSISADSGSAGSRPVRTDRTYTMENVVDLFRRAFSYYYEYTQWVGVTERWSDFLLTQDEPVSLFQSFTDTQVARVVDTPGILNALTGMVSFPEYSSQLALDPDENDCLPAGSTTNITLGERGGRGDRVYYIDWGTFTSVVTRGGEQSRVDAARKLGTLFETGCAKSLSRIFATMSEIFAKEHPLMKAYLDEWNSIFTGRQPESLTVVVTLSNVGTFGTYVRQEIRAAIGSPGPNEKIGITLASDDRDSDTSPYLPVPSRSATTHEFRIALDDEDTRNRIHGAFTSDLNYIRVGVLASSGESFDLVLSSVTPFSTAARQQARTQVDNIIVEF